MVAVAIATVVVVGLAATPGRAGPSDRSSQRATHKTYTAHGHIEIGHTGWPCLGLAESCHNVTHGQFRSTCRIEKVFPNGTQGFDAHVFEIPKAFQAPGSKITLRGVAAAGISDVDVDLFFFQPYLSAGPGGIQEAPCRISGGSHEEGDEVDVDLLWGTRWVIAQLAGIGLASDIDVTMELTTPIRSGTHRD